MQNIVGYTLGGHFNDTYMFAEDIPVNKNPDAPNRCSGCGYRIDFFPHDPNYVFRRTFRPAYMPEVIISKKTTALSATYDGQVIVSREFKEFCLQQGYRGLSFLEFLHDKEHFHLIVTPQVQFDSARRQTQFSCLCRTCGNYRQVIGALPAFLQVTEPLADGFYRTDLLFASGNEKHPLIIVGVETRSKLKTAKLKGLELEPAYGLD